YQFLVFECGKDIGIDIPHSFILFFKYLIFYSGNLLLFSYFFRGYLQLVGWLVSLLVRWVVG
ncbi:MAG: hypothetical protein K9L75_03305, partial [Spirochaetia bacterium]|nr:hypothetical protein [Spirochaetia bacterium]